MPTIDISIEDISQLIGLEKLDVKELDRLVSYTIAEVDSEPEGPDENGNTKVTIDVKTSNRPDLWSAEGMARVIRGMYDQPGMPDISVMDPKFEIIVDESVKEIRPYIGASIVHGLVLSDFLIKQLIQVQDKLDFSFGRKRKRTSIGIYNINMLKSPIKYITVDRNFKFQPLQFDHELTVNEIFEQHPKGIEYKHILEPYDRVPMLVDITNRVLSMPPIINSNDVGRVTEKTTDVLVEVTGTNYWAVQQALLVVTQVLRDRGGIIEAVKIHYPDTYELKEDITPHSKPIEVKIDPKEINRYLGTRISKDKMVKLLRSRRNDAIIAGNEILVKMPPWRRDVLHWVDLSEEVAIAYGYNEFKPTTAEVVTTGKLARSTEDENMFRQILVGLGLIEVLNYTLTNEDTLAGYVRRDEKWLKENCVSLSNPVSLNFNYARSDILPGLIRFASLNKHNEYPQKIFESGECVIRDGNEVITRTSVAVLLAGVNETFETIQSILDTLTRLIGTKYKLKPITNNFYLDGRSAEISINNIIVGHIGEIHPEILEKYGLEVPMSGMEIFLDKFPGINCPAIYTNKV